MQFRNPHTFGPQAFPRLSRENGIIEKREKWRQATQATGHGKPLSYQELLNICKLNTLECRKKQQSLILLFKFISNIGPKYIRDFFSIRETSYNLRNGVNLCFPNLILISWGTLLHTSELNYGTNFQKMSSCPIMLIFFKSKLRSTQL